MVFYPIKFDPIFKEKIWGGKKLKNLLNKNLPQNKPIGESWELSDRPEGISIVKNGEYKGLSIKQLLGNFGKDIIGNAYEKYKSQFPILIKFIDANDILSVQVHPDDEYAVNVEKDLCGKTEMWYVLHADENSKIIAGLKSDIFKDYNSVHSIKEEIKNSLTNGNLESLLNEFTVNKGDVIFIPAGRIHSIGKGIVLAEIQQNSDTTYRLYDWNRLENGKPRPLNIEKAIECIDVDTKLPNKISPKVVKNENNFRLSELISCSYFLVELLELHCSISENSIGSFVIYMNIEGYADIVYGDNKTESLSLGETILIPACMEKYSIEANNCKILKIYISDNYE
jgi:mannose-6-phosphate isomerase